LKRVKVSDRVVLLLAIMLLAMCLAALVEASSEHTAGAHDRRVCSVYYAIQAGDLLLIARLHS